MLQIWNSITDAQAMLISGGLTFMAAVVGVLLGAGLFGGRVAKLKDAIETTEQEIEAFRENVREQLEQIEPQLSAVLALVSELRTAAADQISDDEPGDLIEAEDVYSDAVGPADNDRQHSREELKALWGAIRSKVEGLASSEELDGRSRAALARIPRYSYDELIWRLDSYGMVDGVRDQLLQANGIWQNYQRRPHDPLTEEYSTMLSVAQSMGIDIQQFQ